MSLKFATWLGVYKGMEWKVKNKLRWKGLEQIELGSYPTIVFGKGMKWKKCVIQYNMLQILFILLL